MTNFSEHFKTEADCLTYLRELRWPNGNFKCPACNHTNGRSLRNRPLIECLSCGKQSSVTSGSIFHGHRVPLLKLFRICWDFESSIRKSASETAAELDLPYSTVWTWMHKLRNLLSENMLWRSDSEVHCSLFQKVLFRRSLESGNTILDLEPLAEGPKEEEEEEEEEEENRNFKANQPANTTLIASTINYLSKTFHGVSTKYLQRYLFQFSFNLGPTKGFETLLSACLISTPVTKKMITDYPSREWVVIPEFLQYSCPTFDPAT